MPDTIDVVREVGLTSLIFPQVSDHSSVISVAPPSLKRVTCSVTSSCTRGRSPLNVPSAVMPVEDEMRLPATFALMQVGQIQPGYFCVIVDRDHNAIFPLFSPSVLSYCREAL